MTKKRARILLITTLLGVSVPFLPYVAMAVTLLLLVFYPLPLVSYIYNLIKQGWDIGDIEMENYNGLFLLIIIIWCFCNVVVTMLSFMNWLDGEYLKVIHPKIFDFVWYNSVEIYNFIFNLLL